MAKSIDEVYPDLNRMLVKLKGSGLYLFLFLYILGMVGALVKMKLWGIVVNGAALFGMGAVINLTKKGFWEEYLYNRRKFAPPPFPYRIVAGGLFGVIETLYLWGAGGVPLFKSILVGALASLGYYLWYGIDPLQPKGEKIEGVALKTLQEGYRKVGKIEQNSSKISHPQLREQIKRVVEVSYRILRELEENPENIDKMRRFLITFLEAVEQLTTSFIKVEPELRREKVEELIALLKKTERQFLEELEKLQREEVEDLQLDMEFLRRELR